MDNITWKNVYVAPFHNDDNCEIFVRDSKNQIVFNKCERNPELYDRLLGKLNGFTNEKFNVTKDYNHIRITQMMQTSYKRTVGIVFFIITCMTNG